MKITIGSDHTGFRFKEVIKQYLKKDGQEVLDLGTHSGDVVDYPSFTKPVAVSVTRGDSDRGIVIGGSGNGEAIVANRLKGVRCALCWNRESAVLARRYDDANMISLSSEMTSKEDALEIIRAWLETPFEGGRHLKRIRQIDEERFETDSQTGKEGVKPSPTVKDIESVEEVLQKQKKDDFNVVISFGYIIYAEGKKSIEFKVDPGLKEPTVIHIPSPDRWAKEIPQWGRDRRSEILDRIKLKCKHLIYRFEEY